MSITRWDPWHGVASLLGRLDGLVPSPWPGFAEFTGAKPITPEVDLRELPDRFEISVSTPGFKPEEVQAEAVNRRVTISGDRRMHEEREDGNWLIREWRAGSFERSIVLPADVNLDDASAEYADGVLHVSLPKRERSSSRNIPVQDGRRSRRLPVNSGRLRRWLGRLKGRRSA